MIAILARATALAAIVVGALPAGAADFRTFAGHGGPVMGLAITGDGGTLLSASFDNSVGLWSLEGDEAIHWLDGHEAAVNTVIPLTSGRAASGSDDFDVIIWDVLEGRQVQRLEGHTGKVMGLSVTRDGTRLASASWDGSVRIWSTDDGRLDATLTEHEGPVNAVAWSGDERRLYTAGYDGTLLEWETATWRVTRRLASHGFGINVILLNEAERWLAYGALDGGTRILALETGEALADLTAGRRPILSLAHSSAGARLAVGDGEGYIMIVGTGNWRVEHDFRAALNGPIWALAFTGSGEGIIAGGIANEAMLWPLDGTDSAPRLAEIRREFHTDPDAVPNGERQFLRKCSICHTLGEDGERRAGPPLAGLFGRRAGSVDGYPYSEAILALDIVWSEETIDALFDIGPDHYIPGTKMPMQQIAKPEDRADLIDFLKRETALETKK
ncbi:c-type cytochrome [Ovoidimarina sediminis]|uniref:c-type cytochrome n=1 Tax=Ovoidimarina sediminis TaxID=3079856 RepID=UPI002913BD29|nr:c-type cytochrome [Rhodophyticola sp. MJ-SS7]MDU8942048.1 c-type cytochrome [Rhodophyticola sp. MJ-SS7]